MGKEESGCTEAVVPFGGGEPARDNGRGPSDGEAILGGARGDRLADSEGAVRVGAEMEGCRERETGLRTVAVGALEGLWEAT